MKQTVNGLTLRATILVLALILAAVIPAMSPLDGVAFAQDAAVAPVLTARALPDGSQVNLRWTETTGAATYNLWRDDGGGFGNTPLATGLTGTTYADSTVMAGQTYAYVVVPLPAADPPLWSEIVEVTIPGTSQTPAKPTAAPDLTATPSGLTSIDLEWTPVATATGYNVIRYNDVTEDWDPIVSGQNVLTHTDSSGLTSGKKYWYLVQAVNAGGEGDWSDYGTATTPTATTVPVLSLSHPARTRVELSWSPVTGTSVEYDLQRRKQIVGGNSEAAGSFERLPTEGLLSGTSYVDDKALFDVDDATSIIYHYRVQAVVNRVQGAWSTAKMATVPSTPNLPGTPTDLTATAAGSDSITLSWTLSDPAATSYRFQWKSGTQAWSSSRESTASTSPHTHTGRSAGTAYTYRVRGVNVNGHSDWSNEDSATTDSAITAEGRLGTPTGLSVSDDSDMCDADSNDQTADVLCPKLSLSWSRVPDADAYEVMRWGPSSIAWEEVDFVANDGMDEHFTTKMPSYTDDGEDASPLAAGMSYSYIVRAVMTNDAGDTATEWGEWTADEADTTQAEKPGQPTLVAESRGDTSVWLSWSPATGADAGGAATGYRLRFRQLPTSTWTNLPPGAGMMTHVHMRLTPGRTYHYQVAAENSSGMGPWTAEMAATTTMSQKPGTPTNVMVVDASDVDSSDGSISDSKLKISWNKVSGASGYEIMRWLTTTTPDAWGSTGAAGGTAAAGEQTAVSGGDTMEFTDDGSDLAVGMTYHYLVRAVTTTAKGDWAAYKSGTTKLARPSPPTLVAVSRGETIVHVSWSAVAGATSYELRFIGVRDKPDNARDSDYTMISLNPANSMHVTHTGRTAGTRYEYSVKAMLPNDVETVWSTPSATNGIVTTRPARPTMFSAQASDHQTVMLTWKNVSFDADGDSDSTVLVTADNYEVQVRKGGEGTWHDLSEECEGTPIECDATHDEGFSDLVAMENTQYYYRLRALGTTTSSLTNSYWVYANETTPDDPDTN